MAPLAVLAGGFLIRTFIIFHDCGHGSFVRSRRANNCWGFVTGLLTWTPYYQWRWEHSIHHASIRHLERLGVGDIWTLTVKEYLESSRWKKSGKLVLQTAESAPVVFGQHRIPPYPPPEFPDSELQSGAMPPIRSYVRRSCAGPVLGEFEDPKLSAVG